VEGIEPTSLDYRSSALAIELHREIILDFRFLIEDWSGFRVFDFTFRVGGFVEERNTLNSKPRLAIFQSSIKNLKSQIKNDLVGPTGLKPAPHGLKGRCSVTRAPDQDIDDFRF
jgi:hypothetical protein